MKTSSAPAQPLPFEPEFIDALRDIFERRIVFNQLLGLRIDQVEPDGRAWARIAMRPDLVGHYAYNRLHGGVISASLDAMAGLSSMAAIGGRFRDESIEQPLHRLSRPGPIDLRIDYLRPAIGESFILESEVLRLGSRVASTRMAFRGADGTLLSTGSGAYIVS